jgi:Fe2+ transport system protein B
MTLQFEDVLSALCSQVTLSNANEAQKIYILNDAKEAKLAHEVLAAYGFHVKVYKEEAASKMYITMPSFDSALVEQKLSAALAYAQSLKQIKQSLDTLSHNPVSQAPDYSIMLADMAAGKQIVIHLTPASHTAASEAIKQAPVAKPKVKTRTVAAAATGAKNSLESGPMVAKSSYKKPENAHAETKMQHLYNRFGGRALNSVYGIFLLIVLMMILYALFTFSKTFLCPDFATAKKNTAWYCQK